MMVGVLGIKVHIRWLRQKRLIGAKTELRLKTIGICKKEKTRICSRIKSTMQQFEYFGSVFL